MPRSTHLLAALTILLLVSAIGALFPGILGSSEYRIESERASREEGHLFKLTRLHVYGDDDESQRDALTLFEDGRRLGPPHSSREEIAALGGGRYLHRKYTLFFSASDNSDPRDNGREYAIIHARLLPWQKDLGRVALASVVLAALILLWRFRERVAGVFRKVENANPLWGTAFFALLAGGYHAVYLLRHPEPTLPGLIKGVPDNDAAGWYHMSREYSLGWKEFGGWRNWAGRRPFYYVFMGSLLALFGPDVETVQIINIVISSLAAGLLFHGLTLLAPFWVAAASTLAFFVLPEHLLYVFTTLTAPLGNVLSVFAFALYVIGLAALVPQEGPRRPGRALVLFLLGGLVLGLANLARPLNLFAAGLIPLTAAYILWRKLRDSCSARFLGGLLAVSLLGMVLALAPWIVRQKLVLGITTISENSAEMLYAATSPKWGRWHPDVSRLGPVMEPETMKERVEFYNRGVAENLRNHWPWYITNVFSWLHRGFMDTMVPAGIALGFLALFAVRTAFIEAPGRLGLLRLAGCTLLLAYLYRILPEVTSNILVLGAVLLALLRADAVLLVAALFLSSIALLALSAGVEERMVYGLNWQKTCLALYALHHLLILAARGAFEPVEDAVRGVRSWGRARRPALTLVILLLTVFLAGTGLAAYRNLLSPVPLPSAKVDPEQGREFKTSVFALPEYAPLRPYADRFRVLRGSFGNDMDIPMAAGESLAHWSDLLSKPKPHRYNLFFIIPGMTRSVFPDAIDPRLIEDGREVLVLILFVPKYFQDALALRVLPDGDGRDGRLLLPPPDVREAWAHKILQGLEPGS